MSRCAPGKEVKERTLSIITYEEHISTQIWFEYQSRYADLRENYHGWF